MMLLLLSNPRNTRQRRACVLLSAVLLCAAPVSAAGGCPPPIDCARVGRNLCKPGSCQCGPCLYMLQENAEGLCVSRKRRHLHGKVAFYPDPDEEVDYLHSVIEKQQVSEHVQIKKPSTANTTSQSGGNSKTDKSPDGVSPDNPSDTTTARSPEVPAPPVLTPEPRTTGPSERAGPITVHTPQNDRMIIIIISLCVAVGAVATILSTVCYVKLHRESQLVKKVDYPAFTGPNVPAVAAPGPSMGDKTLAQSAHMYHYQHQKQQILSIGIHKPEQKGLSSEVTSDEEEVGGDFTVYECPGLAPTGEMEVKNPLFDDSAVHYQGNQSEQK